MISIIYPKDDFLAADIAIKTSMDFEDIDVYPVPKYPGRNENLVFTNLRKSLGVIFIMTDPNIKIDTKTKKELKFVLEEGKEIYLIVPEGVETIKNLKNKTITYNPYDINDLIEKINRTIKQFQSQKQQKDIIILSLLLMVLALLLFHAQTSKIIIKSKTFL